LLLTTDIFKKDFLDKKKSNFFELEVNNTTYGGVTLTSNTALKKYPGNDKEALTTSLSAKWKHATGFTLDKIKFSGVGQPIVVENSLEGVIPDLKIEFQGDDSNKADLLGTYKIKPATIKAKFDIMNQKEGEISATAGSGPITAGAILSYSSDSKSSSQDLSATVKYDAGPLSAAVISSKMFKNFDILASYAVAKDITVAGKIVGESGKDKTVWSSTAAAIYKCNPATTLKAKLTTDAVLGLSVNQAVDKNLKVSAWAETAFPPAKGGLTVGLKAVLG